MSRNEIITLVPHLAAWLESQVKNSQELSDFLGIEGHRKSAKIERHVHRVRLRRVFEYVSPDVDGYRWGESRDGLMFV